MASTIDFRDQSGQLHTLEMSAADQATLLAQGSRRRQEQWLIAQQYLEPDLPEEATAPAPDPTEAIAALAAIEARLQATEQQVQQFSTAEALGQLQLELQRWSAQAARVSMAHAELSAVADQTVARCDATGAAAQARLDQLNADQAAMAAAISAQLTADQATATAAINNATSTIATALADARAEALSEARAVAAQQVGPQGQPGAATVLCLEDPMEVDAASFASRWLGRPLAEGDGALVIQSDQLLVRRFANGRWATGPSIVPRQELVSAKISALDASTKVTSLQTISGGGGGGGVGEHLLVNRIGVGGSIAVADSSNWAGVSDVYSGQILAELTALDGSLVGMTYLVLIPFTWSTASDQFTVYGDLGELAGRYDINVSIRRSPAQAPAGYIGTMPPGANRTVVFLSVVAAPGGGGDTTSFRLGGDVEWAHVAQGAPLSVGSGGLQPLWIWS